MTEQESRKITGRVAVLIGMGIAGLMALGAIVVLQSSSTCDGIFAQTAPRIQANLEIIRNKGAFAVEQQKIQELSESAQKVGLHLKTCCAVLDAGALDSGQFQRCLDQAAAYDRKIEEVALKVSEAADAQAAGSDDVVQASVATIRQGIRAATADAARFSREVAEIRPPAPVKSGSGGKGREAEPNNTAAQATELRISGQVNGEVSTPEDPDFYKIVATRSLRDRVMLRLHDLSESLRPYMTIYNHNKSKITDVYDNTHGATIEYGYTAEPGTHYYVKVYPWESSGKYRITAEYLNAHDRHEPNDQAQDATAMASGDQLSANVMDHRDADWYRLDSAVADKVNVLLENGSNTLRPYVVVYNTKRSKLLEKYDNTRGASLEFSFDAVPGEDYFLQVVPWESQGEYRLTVR